MACKGQVINEVDNFSTLKYEGEYRNIIMGEN